MQPKIGYKNTLQLHKKVNSSEISLESFRVLTKWVAF
jgi:hypothetical protein